MFRVIMILGILSVMFATACGFDETNAERTNDGSISEGVPSQNGSFDGPLEYRFMANSFYASFVEGYGQIVNEGVTDQINIIHDEIVGDYEVDFLHENPLESATTVFMLSEEEALLWQDGGIDFNGTPSFAKRPTFLWSVFPATCMTISALDPEIRSVYDLTGKRMNLGGDSNANLTWRVTIAKVLKAANIDHFETQLDGYTTHALADDEIDAILGTIVFADSRNASSGSTNHRLARATGTFHFVDIPPAVIEKVREQNPRWVAAGTLERVVLKPGFARKAFGTDYNVVPDPELNCLSGNGVHWGISPDADAEAVYQMTKAILDNVDIGNTYWPYLMPQWGERLGHIWAPQNNFHPGAKRAYEETGTSFGTPGIREWEAANPAG